MRLNLKATGSVVINNTTYQGKNIFIEGDKVVVDGVVQENTLVGDISVNVMADVENLSMTSGSVKALRVDNVSTTSGDVMAEDIRGNVNTTSGDVSADSITGSVSTHSGDIIYGGKQ